MGYKKRRAFAVPVDNIIERKKQKAKVGQMKFPSDLGQYSMLLNFQEYKFLSDREGELEQISLKDSIQLPLPANLEQAYNVDVDSKSSIGPIVEASLKGLIDVGDKGFFEGELFGGFSEALGGEAAQDNLSNAIDATGVGARQGAGPITKVIQADQKSITTKTKTKPTTGVRYGKAAAGLATAVGLPKSIATGIEASLGAIYNPVLAATFKGVPLRGHSFNWKLIPRNAQESANLNGIVRKIRHSMHPDLTGLRENGGFILEYPNIVTPVLLMPDNDQNIFYKPGLITNFKVTHGKDQKAFFGQTGNPVVYDIQLDYTELDIITKEDFDALENRDATGKVENAVTDS